MEPDDPQDEKRRHDERAVTKPAQSKSTYRERDSDQGEPPLRLVTEQKPQAKSAERRREQCAKGAMCGA